MAYQALTKNLQDNNPFTYAVVNGATAPNGNDVALLYNQATVTSRQDLITIVENMVLTLQTASGTGFGPP
jgi:hypothetical protein